MEPAARIMCGRIICCTAVNTSVEFNKTALDLAVENNARLLTDESIWGSHLDTHPSST